MCFLLVVSTVFGTDNRSVYHELLYFINNIIQKKIAFFALSRHVLHIVELCCLIKSVIRVEQDGSEINNITDKCYKILHLLNAPESQFLAYIIYTFRAIMYTKHLARNQKEDGRHFLFISWISIVFHFFFKVNNNIRSATNIRTITYTYKSLKYDSGI